jgi:hypothetical protein
VVVGEVSGWVGDLVWWEEGSTVLRGEGGAQHGMW